MRRFITLILSLSLLGVALACRSIRPQPRPTPAVIQATPDIDGPGGALEDLFGTPVITIDNQTPYDICYVYISPSEATSWGSDRLSATEIIYADATWDFAVSSEPHDVLVRACNDAVLGTAWEIEVPTTLTLGGRGLLPLWVTNTSSEDICYLLISPSTADTWGDDQLGLHEIIPGGDTRIFFVPPDTYDMKASTCEQAEIQSDYAIEVSAEYVWNVDAEVHPFVPSGEPFVITLENRTPNDICYVHISPSEASGWGADWLEGGEVLAPDASRQFEVPGGAHDVTIRDCDDFIVETAWEVSTDTTLRPGTPGNVAVRIINESSAPVCYLYIAPAIQSDWGQDQLGSQEVISAGDGQRIFYIAPGVYDLAAQDCADNELSSQYEVNLQTDLLWTITD